MYDGESTLRQLLDDLAWIDRRESPGGVYRMLEARGAASPVGVRGVLDVRRRHQGARAGLSGTTAGACRRGVLPSAPRCPAVDCRRRPGHRGSHRRVRQAVAVDTALRPPVPDGCCLRFTQRPRSPRRFRLLAGDGPDEPGARRPAPAAGRSPSCATSAGRRTGSRKNSPSPQSASPFAPRGPRRPAATTISRLTGPVIAP